MDGAMGNCDLYLAASLLVLIVSIHLSLDLLFNMPLPNALFAQAKTKAMIEAVSKVICIYLGDLFS